ncbi:hypothetical protein B0H14DRAFT_2287675, partial [Mycena olivaceomarginata]
VLPAETELDKLLISTIEAGKDDTQKSVKLFGPVVFVTNPVLVTISGVCKNAGKHTAHAGAAAFFGKNSGLNQRVRVWGKQDNARADLVALLIAIQAAPTTKSLTISTRSEYAIRSIKYYASRNSACGWKCPNGDILKIILEWIRSRTAPIHFVHIKKGTVSATLKAAKALADEGS